MGDLFDTMGGGISAVVIISALASCVIACALVVIDTAFDTIDTIREMLQNRKNKKTKN